MKTPLRSLYSASTHEYDSFLPWYFMKTSFSSSCRPLPTIRKSFPSRTCNEPLLMPSLASLSHLPCCSRSYCQCVDFTAASMTASVVGAAARLASRSSVWLKAASVAPSVTNAAAPLTPGRFMSAAFSFMAIDSERISCLTTFDTAPGDSSSGAFTSKTLRAMCLSSLVIPLFNRTSASRRCSWLRVRNAPKKAPTAAGAPLPAGAAAPSTSIAAPLMPVVVVGVVLLLLLAAPLAAEEEEEEEEKEEESERRGVERGITSSDSWPNDMTMQSEQSTAALVSRSGLSKLTASGTPRNSHARDGPYAGGLLWLMTGRCKSCKESSCWFVCQRSATRRFSA